MKYYSIHCRHLHKPLLLIPSINFYFFLGGEAGFIRRKYSAMIDSEYCILCRNTMLPIPSVHIYLITSLLLLYVQFGCQEQLEW
ncbi:hypothetical protein JB92DRAFT_1069523 [Gautieria morchelliformis]|nr:hypothetical protein JB92DRAFT_1069523 [Gautieria morchelliformis]